MSFVDVASRRAIDSPSPVGVKRVHKSSATFAGSIVGSCVTVAHPFAKSAAVITTLTPRLDTSPDLSRTHFLAAFVMAADKLLDRANGKPAQEYTGKEGGPLVSAPVHHHLYVTGS
jgi:hypothetical protein